MIVENKSISPELRKVYMGLNESTRGGFREQLRSVPNVRVPGRIEGQVLQAQKSMEEVA